MALRILHVFSSDFYAGSVAYAVTLAEQQQAEGHPVWMATDEPSYCKSLPTKTLRISNRRYWQRLYNIIALRKMIRQHRIDIVHAHSRAASWVAYFAVKGSNAVLVSTVHGRQVRHKFSRFKKVDVYGERIITVCAQLKQHLEEEIGLPSHKIVLVPNGIHFGHHQTIKTVGRGDGKIVLSLLGRFNGPKGRNMSKIVCEVLPALLRDYNNLHVHLAGGDWETFPREGRLAWRQLEQYYGERVRFHGFLKNPHLLMAKSDVLVGSGRVAIEGLLHQVKVLAIGEASCHGLINRANLEVAMLSNFGDILTNDACPGEIDMMVVGSELEKAFRSLAEPEEEPLHKLLREYDVRSVYPKIMQVYASARMQGLPRRSIPILMYHKVPDTALNTRHRTFVTRDNFEKHLRFFRFRGLKPITFKDYQDFALGQRSWKEFPKKPFILTFDDGYEDNYRNMLPLCNKYGFKGVLFLLGDRTAKHNHWDKGEDPAHNRLMTLPQKRGFVEAGWEIGAHTMGHYDLTACEQTTAMSEISQSKRELEQQLGVNVISFAYPYGFHNEHVRAMVKQAGFQFGLSTDTGGYSLEEDRFAIFRVNMFPEESWWQLFKKNVFLVPALLPLETWKIRSASHNF